MQKQGCLSLCDIVEVHGTAVCVIPVNDRSCDLLHVHLTHLSISVPDAALHGSFHPKIKGC